MAPTGDRKLIQGALAGYLKASRGEKRRIEESQEDYEDDGFVVKPKKIHMNGSLNGEIVPFGGHEYDEETQEEEEEEDEEILSDPSDLSDSDSESEPELEDVYIPADKVRSHCMFVDDEATEDTCDEESQDADTFLDGDDDDDDDEDGWQTADEDSDSDADSERDKSIRSPLKKANFIEEEAVECNNIQEMYGGIVGRHELSSSSEGEDSVARYSHDATRDADDQLTDISDEDTPTLSFKRQRNRVLESDDSSEEEVDGASVDAVSSAASVACPSQVKLVNYTDTEEEELQSQGLGSKTESRASPLRSRRQQLLRHRYLSLRRRVKPWIVQDIVKSETSHS